MENLNQTIQEYLAQEEPDFLEGVRLYAQHPKAKKNLVRNFELLHNKKIMHEKLVYELEVLIGAEKYSGKCAFLITNVGTVPVKISKETEAAAPKNFEYTVKFADLPEDLKKLAVEKGKLYSELATLKKSLAAIGKQNDDDSLDKRVSFSTKMQSVSNRIIAIHAVLVKYDVSKEIDLSALTVTADEPKDDEAKTDSQWDEESIEKEFGISKMEWFQKKDLLKRLQSNVFKQLERAETSKKEATRLENKMEAEKSQAAIAVLQKFFDEFPEANV